MNRFQIVWFEIFVVREDFGFGGFAAEEFEQELHGITKSPDARLTVTDVRGGSDPLEEFVGGHDGKLSVRVVPARLRLTLRGRGRQE
jgi:hypothetical protein